MEEGLEKYGLSLFNTMILEEYVENLPVFNRMREIVLQKLGDIVSENGLFVTAVEARVKAEASLAGKLELKSGKYSCLSDITDILGSRIVTFYNDDVDRIAAIIENEFDVDWDNSVDKRKILELDRFGYMSLHYILRIPKEMFFDEAMPQINAFRFELQLRTALQHVWATMYHDTGYKSGVEIPPVHLRNLNRLAGMLELADDEFSRTRALISDYRHTVQNLVSSGKFDEVALNGDTFKSYLELKPFDALTRKIASVNQAEIHQGSMTPFLKALKGIGMKTLGDVETLIKENSDDAYKLACLEIGGTDLDIISSTIAVQDICEVFVIKSGGGIAGMVELLNNIYGKSDYNSVRAERILDKVSHLNLTHK